MIRDVFDAKQKPTARYDDGIYFNEFDVQLSSDETAAGQKFSIAPDVRVFLNGHEIDFAKVYYDFRAEPSVIFKYYFDVGNVESFTQATVKGIRAPRAGEKMTRAEALLSVDNAPNGTYAFQKTLVSRFDATLREGEPFDSYRFNEIPSGATHGFSVDSYWVKDEETGESMVSKELQPGRKYRFGITYKAAPNNSFADGKLPVRNRTGHTSAHRTGKNGCVQRNNSFRWNKEQ